MVRSNGGSNENEEGFMGVHGLINQGTKAILKYNHGSLTQIPYNSSQAISLHCVFYTFLRLQLLGCCAHEF